MKIKMIFNQITWIFKKNLNVYILEKSLMMKFNFFSFEKNMKNIRMVKVDSLCMGQRMMWDNVIMFPFH